MIGDNALVFSLISEIHIEEVQDSGVFQHLPTLLLVPGKVLNVGIIEDLAVFAPGRGHGGVTAAHSSAHQGHICASQGHRGLWVHSDLWFREIIWKEKHKDQLLSS